MRQWKTAVLLWMSLMLFNGCSMAASSNEVQDASPISYEMLNAEVETMLYGDSIELDMAYFEVDGLADEDLESKINNRIFNTLKSWQTRMAAEANVTQQEIRVTCVEPSIISYMIQSTTSPSEGIQYMHTDGFNIHRMTGELIAKEELFLQDATSIKRIESVVNEAIHYKGFDAELLTMDHNPIDGFYVTDSELVLYYYEGSQREVRIPLESIENYLTF